MASEDHTVVITGGAGGIGLATARRLLHSGARVALLDLDAGDVQRRVGELTATGSPERAIGTAFDTTDERSVASAMAFVRERFGSFDGLVTTAGVRQTAASALELDLATWERTQTVNVTGTFLAAREAARVMIDSGRAGSIVTVGSVTGVSARMGQSAYCASKAAVIHLTRVLALEWAEHGIRVNTVSPGVTNTAMIAQAVRTDGPDVLNTKLHGSLKEFRPGIPLGRLSEPDEQAAAIEYLLSDRASFVTGACLGVDGGAGIV